MRLLIGADRKFGNVSCHRSVSHLQHNIGPAAAALLPLLELEATGVGNKVSFPDAAGMGFSLAAEVIGLAVKAVDEVVGYIKDEVRIVEEVKDDRHAVDGEKPGRLITLAVEVLVPDVQRQREQAPLLPFEGLLGPFVVPNCRCAPSLENINQLFVELSLRLQALSSGNLAYVGAGCPSRPLHVDEGSLASGSLPMSQLNLFQILDKEGFDDRYALSPLPLVIVGNIVHYIFKLGCRLGHLDLQTILLFHTASARQKQGRALTTRRKLY